MRNIVLLLAATIAVPGIAFGQLDELSSNARKHFPDASVVFVERSATLTFTIEGDSLKAFTDFNEDLLHLKNQTENYAINKVYGSSFSRVDKLRARTLVWEKNKYKEIPVNGWTRNSANADHVFYDDSYFYAFNYPSIAANNRTQLSYREIHTDVRMISGFFFSTYAPQMVSKFTLKAPRGVDIHFEVRNDPSGKVRLNKQEKGNTVTYEWTAVNMPEARSDDGSPSLRYYEPHLVCYVKSFQGKTKRVDVLPNLGALHQWYRSFVTDVDESTHPALEKIVQDIRSKYTSEDDIAKAVFYWVQDNIQYIAFEDGMRGFVPHKGSYTVEKRYGDCKDMATLVVTLLKMAGIKNAHLTWIGTRHIPYRYTELPSPDVSNHMIATYVSPSGKYYFLDATDSYAPFGFPSAMTQGKEALISIDNERYEVKEVPVIDPDDNLIIDSLTVSVDNNMLLGKGSLSLAGLSKSSTGYEFTRVEEKSIRDFIVNIAGKGSNKFYLDSYKVRDNKIKDVPTRVDYEFRIGDYFQRLGDELYINLNLSKDNYNRQINEKMRTTPHEFEHQYRKTEYIDFQIPAGYAVDYLPKDDAFKGKLLSYDISYKVAGNSIQLKITYSIDYLLMLPAQFAVWNEEISRLSEAYRETIILKKTN